jgi:double-stranded uracil-DNA glycosylase
LILGSMPGAASLAAQAYYAHPRNALWPLLGELLDFDSALPYPARIAALLARHVGLWDVIAACTRPGSLDASIDRSSIELNPLNDLIEACPALERVLTNGTTASQLFERHSLGAMRAARPSLEWFALPSTSPANAAQPLANKRAAWAAALEPVRPRTGPA